LWCGSNPFWKGVDRNVVPLNLRAKVPPVAYNTYDRLEREAKEVTKALFKYVTSELEATPL
jgi:hypothetical protein